MSIQGNPIHNGQNQDLLEQNLPKLRHPLMPKLDNTIAYIKRQPRNTNPKVKGQKYPYHQSFPFVTVGDRKHIDFDSTYHSFRTSNDCFPPFDLVSLETVSWFDLSLTVFYLRLRSLGESFSKILVHSFDISISHSLKVSQVVNIGGNLKHS
ncbi:hypothetical protein V6N13_134980 [Hibiscus sabdariffa]